MVDEQPELTAFLDKVRRISERLTYPVKDSRELVELLGGEQATIDWEGVSYQVDEAVKIVADYYFPIKSEEDLFVKAVNLELLRPDSPLALVEMASEQKLPAEEPPSRTVEDYPSPAAGTEGGPAVVVGERAPQAT
jgi:hypothetical protein